MQLRFRTRAWPGAVDPDVAQACQKEARALVTLDLDFSDIRAYPPEDYQGDYRLPSCITEHHNSRSIEYTNYCIAESGTAYRPPLDCGGSSGPDPGRESRRDSCEMTSGCQRFNYLRPAMDSVIEVVANGEDLGV